MTFVWDLPACPLRICFSQWVKAAGIPPIAQEPPAMRPPAAEVLTKIQLQSMICALEGLLRSLPAGSQLLPKDKVEAINGAFLQDWRTLSASSRYCRERVCVARAGAG